jgi:hypothetical protein
VAMKSFLPCVLLLAACPDPEPPCEPKTLIRGPWTTGLHARQAEVRWETAEEGCGGLRFGADATENWAASLSSSTHAIVRTIEVGTGVLDPPDLPGTSYQHRVTISNLEPNRCFSYQISQTSRSHKGRFCTAAETTHETTVFAVIGDTNPMLGHTELLYGPMAAARPQAIFHLGDIQYYASIIETWAAWFERTKGLLAIAPILPVVGNHEFEAVGGSVGEEDSDPTEYTEYFLPLWGDHGHPHLGNNYSVRNAGILYIFADSETDDGLAIWDQRGTDWLAQTLTTAEATAGHSFSVLMFHRPVYTRSKYSAGLGRRNQLEQMLAGHKVPLIMTGHAHCYERFDVNGRTVIVSGGGGAVPHRCDREHEDPVLSAELASMQQTTFSGYHWVKLSQTSAGLAGEAIAEDGTILDRWEVRP